MPRALIFWYVNTIDLYQVFKNFALWDTNGSVLGVTCFALTYIGKHDKIFLSETTRNRALLFGMQNHPVDYYQVCSNYVPETRIGPAAGVTQANNKSTF